MLKKLYIKLKNRQIEKINNPDQESDGIILPLTFSYGLKLKLVKIKRKVFS
jgi:hypothetical protein